MNTFFAQTLTGSNVIARGPIPGGTDVIAPNGRGPIPGGTDVIAPNGRGPIPGGTDVI
jgi:hypothetical protein